MPKIKPVSNLRNYGEVLRHVAVWDVHCIDFVRKYNVIFCFCRCHKHAAFQPGFCNLSVYGYFNLFCCAHPVIYSEGNLGIRVSSNPDAAFIWIITSYASLPVFHFV